MAALVAGEKAGISKSDGDHFELCILLMQSLCGILFGGDVPAIAGRCMMDFRGKQMVKAIVGANGAMKERKITDVLAEIPTLSSGSREAAMPTYHCQ